MKLKNKKTGEIVSLEGEITYDDKVRLLKHYRTLDELCEEWEDYKEPKEYWCVNSNGEVISCVKGISEDSRRPIGNYFETREEAEKAVEKLKAWKRLKDKGFEFKHHEIGSVCGQITEVWARANFSNGMAFLNDTIKEDLTTLFGGEE